MTEEKYLEKLLSLPHEYKVKLMELPDEYIEKLLELPEKIMAMAEEFNQAIFQQDYRHAKYTYDSIIRLVEILKPPVEVRKYLFGDWDDNESEVSEGVLRMDWANEAYEHCAFKLYESYEHESFRRFGQRPQYYPDPRYPVPGYKK